MLKILCGFNETKPKLYVLPRISEIDDQVKKKGSWLGDRKGSQELGEDDFSVQ